MKKTTEKPMRIILATLLFLVGIVANAQGAANGSKLSWGIRGGLTFAPTNWDDTDVKVFPTVGLAASCCLAKTPLRLESGLYYTNRYVYDYNNHSLLLPVLVSVGITAKDDATINPFVGPFVAYGFNEDDIDGGLRIGIEYRRKKLRVNFGYDLSMTYGVDEDALFLCVGYDF